MYGSLEVICGPMFSGKTTELLKRILWVSNGQGQKIAVFKPAYDQRYAKMKLVSHEGLAADAESIYHWGDTNKQLVKEKVNTVFFDEVQFFTAPHFRRDIVEIIQSLLESGINVVASGLDMDWKGRSFTITAMLMGMAEDVTKKKAICAVCGRPASRSYKKKAEGPQIEVGGSEMYEARCLHHWSMPDNKQVELFKDFEAIKPIDVTSSNTTAIMTHTVGDCEPEAKAS